MQMQVICISMQNIAQHVEKQIMKIIMKDYDFNML